MEAKIKAKELVEKFKPMCHNVKHTGILNGLATVINDDIINFYAAKQCALIAVDEIMKVEQAVKMNFWKAVKQEIKKLEV